MAGIANPLVNVFAWSLGVKLGPRVRFVGFPVLVRARGSQVSIGEGCTVNSSFFSNLAGMYGRTVIVAREGACIHIGDHVGLSGVTLYARSSITIGDRTLLGVNVKILDNDFHPVEPAARLSGDGAVPAQPVVIGSNVFVGANALILKGVYIGDNAVVGAGSVVTRDVPADSVVAGNPATVVKYLVNA